MGLGARELLPERQCASGEKVALGASRARAEPPAAAEPAGRGPLKGAAAPAGFRAVGFIEAAAAKK
jgi:hypothetical protein